VTLDEGVLAEAEKARDQMEAAQDEVESARAAYHRAIRRLHAAGGTLREIGEALGLSYQRVHQVVDSGSMIEDKSASAAAKGDVVRCTFCDRSQKVVKKLIAGPGVYICDDCIKAAPKGQRGLIPIADDATKSRCSFCGKKRQKVESMVMPTSGAVRICNECLDLCVEILIEEG
jgi:hypothetical protein